MPIHTYNTYGASRNAAYAMLILHYVHTVVHVSFVITLLLHTNCNQLNVSRGMVFWK